MLQCLLNRGWVIVRPYYKEGNPHSKKLKVPQPASDQRWIWKRPLHPTPHGACRGRQEKPQTERREGSSANQRSRQNVLESFFLRFLKIEVKETP